MSELFLIAHKVRGEPAFDIAERMECPLCAGHGHDLDGYCHECDSLGYWWIIPSSGHRAYPYWNLPLNITTHDFGLRLVIDHNPTKLTWTIGEMPSDWPDHYPLRHTPSAPHVDILALLPQEPKATIRRRL